ncbi:hypothetical protein SGPA1_11193 [Streptomyces misionensis JCM 4497]
MRGADLNSSCRTGMRQRAIGAAAGYRMVRRLYPYPQVRPLTHGPGRADDTGGHAVRHAG